MEPPEVASVLARASDLQDKINHAIFRASSSAAAASTDSHTFGDLEGLRATLEALVALEDHLDSLQALQRQQKAERVEVLVELEESRKLLIKKLKEYNGEEWDLIQEAHAFVGEAIQQKDDLVLPPYQSPVPDMPLLQENAGTGSSSKRSLATRRVSSSNRFEREREGEKPTQLKEVTRQDGEEEALGPGKFSGFSAGIASLIAGVGHVVEVTTKTALVLASVITILTFSRLGPRSKKGAAERVLRLQPIEEIPKYQGSRSSTLNHHPLVQDDACPPGKVLRVEDGLHKCFVKERVEAPFKEVIKQPDASYGYG